MATISKPQSITCHWSSAEERDRELRYCRENEGSVTPPVYNAATKYNTNITATVNVPPLVGETWAVSVASMQRK
jgi:hypothetical protein